MSLHVDDSFELPRFTVRQPSHPQMAPGIPDDAYYDDKRPLPRMAPLDDMPALSPMGTPQLPSGSLSRSQSMAGPRRQQHPDDLERTLSESSRPYYAQQQYDPYASRDPYAQAQEHIRRGSYTTDQHKDYSAHPQMSAPYAAGTPTASNTYNDPYAPRDVKAEPQSPRFQYPPGEQGRAPYPQDMRTPYSPMDAQPASAGAPRAYAPPARAPSASTPNTPMTNAYAPRPPSQYYAPKPARQGFRPVRDPKDLQPRVNPAPPGRRFSEGIYLSPLRALTTHIAQTYNICNPEFRYETAHNPRRVLTKPSKPVHNDGYDNEDYDYILYVNDWLGPDDGRNKYLILDVLGQGTFGQVVKCQNIKTHEIVAVKVVKNKPAYFNQSMMEVTILELLNTTWDPNDEHHILRMRDQFIHKNHLCLVFELLSSNLYELIKQNQFGGLSTQLVKVFTTQLLDALTVLNEARLIHCDLKPENILLMSLQSPQIKVIDFGSACHERQTVYTYIQSRFYRSPEVLLGMSYTSAIDMWSLGCIAVELFLGLPLFPGTSEYNQITRIVEMLGMPPSYMLEMGKQTNNFFSSYTDEYGRKRYRLKSLEQYSREHNTNEQPGKKYFAATTLPDIIRTAAGANKSGKLTENDKESNSRASFIDFVSGLLNLNPIERWSPQQAKGHPFITGERFERPYIPSGTNPRNTPTTAVATPAVDPKRPYGGLVPQQTKGQRAYQDAATYNAHLNQHQVYTAQAAANQSASQAFRNPYAMPPPPQSQPQQQQPPPPPSAYGDPGPVPGPVDYGQQQQAQRPPMQHQQSSQSIGGQAQYGAQGGNRGAPPPNPPSSSYYPPSRTRANTINQMDIVPPALARIANNIGVDASALKRNTLTPVLNREEAIKEWERRQTGKRTHQPYPQLEYLQQQAELSSSAWSQQQPGGGQQPGRFGMPFNAPPAAVVHDIQDKGGMRGGPVRYDQQPYVGGTNQYRPSGGYQPNNGYEPGYDRVDSVGSMYAPLQPSQYYGPGAAGAASGPAGSSSRGPVTSPPSSSASFYGGGVVPSGQPHRNLFQPGQGQGNAQGGGQTSPQTGPGVQDLSGDLDGDPIYRQELLRRVEWPDYYDVASPDDDPMARYRPRNARQQPTAGGGEGSRSIPDSGVPMQQFVLTEQRAEVAEHENQRLRKRVGELECELGDLKLSYGEQTKKLDVLKRKYDEVVSDNVIVRENNRLLEKELESKKRKLEEQRKKLKGVRSAGLVLSRVHSTLGARLPHKMFDAPCDDQFEQSEIKFMSDLRDFVNMAIYSSQRNAAECLRIARDPETLQPCRVSYPRT
ncbi:dual specificity protein kinase yak1 [Ceratobasidium sp. 392]|nr:dual specificity protein kinase yak1 [Ceratobasidium sp. 392]